MPATPPATLVANATQNANLRQQLAETDQKRRRLILALFLNYGGDTEPILELLFDTVSTATLDRVEAMVREGGEP